VEAQTLANDVSGAEKIWRSFPVLNKIDLPGPIHPESKSEEIEAIIWLDTK